MNAVCSVEKMKQLGWSGGAAVIDVDARCGWDVTEKLIMPRSLALPTLPFSERLRGNASEFEVYSRVNIQYNSVPTLYGALKDPRMGLVDLIAIQPKRNKDFLTCIQVVETCQKQGVVVPFDIIQLDLSQQLDYRFKPQEMVLFRKARVFLELCYADTLPVTNAASRAENRNTAIIGGISATTFVSRGHLKSNGQYTNIITSSGNILDPVQLRTPEQVIEIAKLFGLGKRNSFASVTTACQAVLERAESRRRKQGWL